MNNIALGRYVPGHSFLHKMDSRIKIVGLIIFFVAVFLTYGTVVQNFIMYGLLFLTFFIFIKIAHLSFMSVLKSLKALWVMMIFLLLINTFAIKTGELAFDINGYEVYWDGIIRTGYIIIRLMLMIMLTTLLTSTSKPLDLTFGLEWLLGPLKLIKVPVHIFAMTISLALRFIPTLMEEANKIMRAQSSRGVDFKEGKLKDKFTAIISLIIPLFVSSFLRSGELADAMETRGYDPNGKRTKYRRKHWKMKETLQIVGCFAILAVFVLLAVYKPDFVSMVQGWF
ncbi:MAG: energy-coupling factor transporter transmembrane component T [Bacilli bacterium]|nr:energy-coupling factor transporter transmembrane component T [Bacilli bacterium]